jgi:hypothetical protein
LWCIGAGAQNVPAGVRFAPARRSGKDVCPTSCCLFSCDATRGHAHTKFLRAWHRPQCQLQPRALYATSPPASQKPVKENANITTHQRTHLGTLECCSMRAIPPGQTRCCSCESICRGKWGRHTETRENCLEVVRGRYRLFRASYLARVTIVVVLEGKG